jgi:hypothetical protein
MNIIIIVLSDAVCIQKKRTYIFLPCTTINPNILDLSAQFPIGQSKQVPNTLTCNIFTQFKEEAIINGSKTYKCGILKAGTYMKSKNSNYTVEFQLDGTIAVYVGERIFYFCFRIMNENCGQYWQKFRTSVPIPYKFNVFIFNHMIYI